MIDSFQCPVQIMQILAHFVDIHFLKRWIWFEKNSSNFSWTIFVENFSIQSSHFYIPSSTFFFLCIKKISDAELKKFKWIQKSIHLLVQKMWLYLLFRFSWKIFFELPTDKKFQIINYFFEGINYFSDFILKFEKFVRKVRL
jgi:hypothetical protein